MASSKFLISQLRHLISGRCCFFFCFLLCFFFLFCERCRSESSVAAKTDPIEAQAVNTILGRWGKTESSLWNISGELCSGVAINGTNTGQLNPSIKCDCTFHNGSVCHITILRVQYQDLAGPFPEEISNLTYLTDLILGGNDLTGPIPAFIGNLSSLRFL
ncbi:probable LRR receptor-like serine/threonine-protein kinase At1g56130 [Dendrobium catenatum]|uniref:probable LRR receptor-like serine/threonine-protein kinase At1g56130 n=1 Tax=Dendrobium catenatum TaxID=906689 RepID=UPI00109FB8EE|nr:probable LRR receptor-like serine/threonine-protein kinase At1g56130 [Dendrobium catenatum]